LIQLHSIAFAPFPVAEPLNPRFRKGHAKLRLVVDTAVAPDVPDQALMGRLTTAFPGLARHHCQVGDAAAARAAGARGVVLVEGEPTANQAHLLEHLLLEMLSFLDRAPRLSGVTCAYQAPPERNDVFVECDNQHSGVLAAHLAIEAMNAALAGEPLAPRPRHAALHGCCAAHDAGSLGWAADWARRAIPRARPRRRSRALPTPHCGARPTR
jgi:hypothetical protein